MFKEVAIVFSDIYNAPLFLYKDGTWSKPIKELKPVKHLKRKLKQLYKGMR